MCSSPHVAARMRNTASVSGADQSNGRTENKLANSDSASSCHRVFERGTCGNIQVIDWPLSIDNIPASPLKTSMSWRHLYDKSVSFFQERRRKDKQRKSRKKKVPSPYNPFKCSRISISPKCACVASATSCSAAWLRSAIAIVLSHWSILNSRINWSRESSACVPDGQVTGIAKLGEL